MESNRQTKYEIIRLLGMFLIVLQHLNFYTFGGPKGINLEAFSSCFVQSFSLIGVNLFILITGYFGTNYKISKIISLLFQCAFCVIPISLIYIWLFDIKINTFQDLFNYFWPLNYWYIVSYIGFLVFVPILNSYFKQTQKGCLEKQLFTFYVFAIIFDWILQDNASGLVGGYSVLWLIFMYLVGRYIRIYNIKIKNKHLSICALSLMLLNAIFLLFHCMSTRYTSPFIFIPSICIFVLISRQNISDSKILNYISGGCTMVYLLHLHPLVFQDIKRFVVGFHETNNIIEFNIYRLVVIFVIFIIAVCYDKIRLYIWNLIYKR